MYKHLYDREFLTQLTLQRHKTQYVRLKVFDKKKRPIEYLEGEITGGSINIDGAAAIRRTCSLNLTVAEDTEITDAYWSLTHEFEVEIGLENTIEPSYDSIIWLSSVVVNDRRKKAVLSTYIRTLCGGWAV